VSQYKEAVVLAGKMMVYEHISVLNKNCV